MENGQGVEKSWAVADVKTKKVYPIKNGFADSGAFADGVEKYVCARCGEIISSEIYTDRFHDYLCEGCLLHLHRV